jgi:hypothetical protein
VKKPREGAFLAVKEASSALWFERDEKSDEKG